MINQSRLPYKYILQVQHMIPGFPRALDVLYEILDDVELLEGKKFNIAYAQLSLSFKIKGSELRNLMDELIREGYIENTGTDKSPIYHIIKHPWE